ncbi:hypothetical protein FRC06_010538, partial [Ceratobasidium sp. 370]
MHLSNTPGDRCTFTFDGTGVWYFTDYRAGNTVVSIGIDGSPAENVNTSPMDNTMRTQRLAWGKTALRSGVHVVTLTHAGSIGSNMSIDFFKYMRSVDSGVSSSGAVSTPNSTPTPTPTPVPTPVPTPTPTPTPTSTSTPTPTSSPASIVVFISVSALSNPPTPTSTAISLVPSGSASIASSHESNSGLSKGAIIGIVFGSIG